MRYIRYLFIAVVGIILVTVALANRQDVSLHLVPIGLPFSSHAALIRFAFQVHISTKSMISV